MNDQQPNDPFDELMRRALAEEADRVEPADALPEIQARVRGQRRTGSRRPWILTAGAATIGTAAAIGAFTVLDDNAGDEPLAGSPSTTTSASRAPFSSAPATGAEPSPAPTPAPTTPPTTTPTSSEPTLGGKPEQVVKSAVVPVYWLGDRVGANRAGEVRLYRTWANVKGRPATEAVRIMTSAKPGDPDYYSVWRGAQLNSVTRSPGLVTVDFKQLPRTRLDAAAAKVAVQQLVYTVQGALAADTERVQVTEQGRTGTKLFGQVDTSTPLARAKSTDVQALIWITSPEDGAATTAPIKVTGLGSAYEAHLNWRILNAKTGRVVAEGPTQTSEAYKFTPFAFVVEKLPPGTYTVEVFEPSAEDGRPTSTDTKTFHLK
ncbi:Gmad2 immunoglobulin-like domain-containing protein [Kribbella sp. CA-247076]|uniref:Gmad2 immunoglobulin-like domain-containing protein n=1 Tax=Kribbella sp. CA-247076 TaxID=3239941 RepID=UPI003D8A06C3